MKKKDSLLNMFESYKMTPIQTRFFSGGRAAGTCDGQCGEETAGPADTWTDTPDDCGKDPDSCDPCTLTARVDTARK